MALEAVGSKRWGAGREVQEGAGQVFGGRAKSKEGGFGE